MAQNIGPKIGIEGEAEYRRQMQNIIQQTKTYQAAVKEAQSALDRNASSQQKAQAKTQALTKAIEAQRKQVEYCQNMLNASKEKYGENATQTLKWEEALHKANTQLNELNQQLADSNRLKAWGEDVVKAGERLEQLSEIFLLYFIHQSGNALQFFQHCGNDSYHFSSSLITPVFTR